MGPFHIAPADVQQDAFVDVRDRHLGEVEVGFGRDQLVADHRHDALPGEIAGRRDAAGARGVDLDETAAGLGAGVERRSKSGDPEEGRGVAGDRTKTAMADLERDKEGGVRAEGKLLGRCRSGREQRRSEPRERDGGDAPFPRFLQSRSPATLTRERTRLTFGVRHRRAICLASRHPVVVSIRAASKWY